MPSPISATDSAVTVVSSLETCIVHSSGPSSWGAYATSKQNGTAGDTALGSAGTFFFLNSGVQPVSVMSVTFRATLPVL